MLIVISIKTQWTQSLKQKHIRHSGYIILVIIWKPQFRLCVRWEGTYIVPHKYSDKMTCV